MTQQQHAGYSALVAERSIAIGLSVCQLVCLSVCPQEYLWNRWTDLHEIFCADPCDRGSVLLWRRCDALSTSGFMNDVTFGRSGPYCDARSGVAIPGRSLMSVNVLFQS